MWNSFTILGKNLIFNQTHIKWYSYITPDWSVKAVPYTHNECPRGANTLRGGTRV